MSIKTVCDLCGKPMEGIFVRHFKVKEYDHIYGRYFRIDVHDDCLRKLIKAESEASTSEGEKTT